MYTFAMIILTLLTVLGSAILGWLARRYALGGRCEPFGSDELARSLPEGSGLAAGAVGTVAAGTAAVRLADDGSGTGSGDSASSGSSGSSSVDGGTTGSNATMALKSAGAAVGTSAKRVSEAIGPSAKRVSTAVGASAKRVSDAVAPAMERVSGAVSGVAGRVSGASNEANTDASTHGEASDGNSSTRTNWFDGDASGSSSGTDSSKTPASSGGSGAGTTTALGAAGAAGVAAKIVSDSDETDNSANSSQDGTGSTAGSPKAERDAGASDAATASSSASLADDEDDDGGALVDVPATLSAEEAEAQRLLDSDEEIAAPSSRLDAPRPTQTPDDLTKIKGIGPKIDGQLNDRGIYYYDQIANFSGSDLAWADRELGFKGRAVRDRWIPQARGLMEASALDASDSASAGVAGSGVDTTSPELTASQAEVRQLRTRLGLNPDSGSGANDPSLSAEERLEASQKEARDLRQQLWAKEQAEASEQGSASNTAAAAATTAATGLGSFGALSAEETEAERLIASGSAPKSASNSLDAPTPGFDPDDLTKIRGIGKPTQSRLNRKGIYYYDQIAGFTAADLAWADKEMNLEGRVVSDRWIPQAKVLAGETESDPASSGAGSTTAAGLADLSDDDADGTSGEMLVDVPSGLTEEEAEAERLLASGEDIAPPASRLDAPRSGRAPDDLTKIKGIGPKINSKLNDQGIYYYDQIAGFKGSDLAWADRELDFKGRAVRDRWVPQARGLMEMSGSGEPTAPAPKTLLDKPIEGKAPDDLTAIKGVGNVLQTQLNEKGIYYYSQIADFTDSDQQWADQTLGFPGRVERDNWIPQARELAAGRAARRDVLSNAGAQLGSMSQNDEPGEMSGDESEAMRLIESGNFVADESNRPTSLLQSASNGPADDLQQIKGVGPKLNDLLNSLGIFYFRQIADFSAKDIAWVDSKLQFKGRIVRDRWVDQAKRLS